MFKYIISLCVFLILACAPNSSGNDNGNKEPKPSSEKDLIRAKIFEKYPNMNPEIVIERVNIPSGQTSGFKVFNISINTYGGFAVIHNNKVIHLIYGLGYTKIQNSLITDLNNDGISELYFTSRFGSGLERGIIGKIESRKKHILESNLAAYYPLSDITLEQKNKQNITVYTVSGGNKVNIGSLNSNSDNLVFKLQTNLPNSITKFIETTDYKNYYTDM